ncbi:hypothetical protein JTB14_003022 [Gonioctena quinquepunctata]|nr:hypothetical protein JTB14_003022 [Gonioctena quinquepunctata]
MSNPFTALLESKDPKKTSPSVNETLENIFGFTINPHHTRPKDILFLEEVHSIHGTCELNLELLQYALFVRLFMCNEDSVLRNNDQNTHAQETRVIKYLYACSDKLNEYKSHLKPQEETEIRDKIMQNVATAIIQPDIYSGQDIVGEVLNVLKEASPGSDVFFVEATNRVLEEDGSDQSLRRLIEQMNRKIVDDLVKSDLVTFDQSVFHYLEVMSTNEILGELLIESCQPKNCIVGSVYATTVIGALLNLSVLPKTPDGKFEHFTNILDQSSNAGTEQSLWVYLEKLNHNLHRFFLSMLKCSPKLKRKVLCWLGDCLKDNMQRGKIWNTHVPELSRDICTATDGFMINMCNLMLGLCQPFCSKVRDEKVLRVDPTYCAVPLEKIEEKAIHMKDMWKETCFLPVSSTEDSEEERLTANSYNFVTECFYMAHKAVDLGYRVGVDKLIRQNHEMGRIQRAFNDALQQTGGNSDLLGTIKDRMTDEGSKYLSLKCVLSDPNLLQKMFDLVSATSFWLCQVAVHDDLKKAAGYAPLNELPMNFPLTGKIPNTLKCIPEFLVENIVSLLVFARRFSPNAFEQQGYEKLSPILSFVLIFMGSPQHLKNPHARARLAEGLESLLPFHKDEPQTNNFLGSQRQKLFTEHPYRLQIVENLMKVFVGIEMTGQSVEFEQKFNYRRPMYTIFNYLWELPEHMECFRSLAEEAERNMEATDPPLFLKFSNILINDAIFLLDEALANMAKLKEMQQAQDNGEWANLSARERTQNVSYLHQIGSLARFDNILGKDTIATLEKLTSRISIVFTHSTMVDRIASMLNYFLLNLVGPNKKNFKVKDAKDYHFDPAATVLEICKIYVNLKDSDSFCLAVSQDGRSYSPTLFSVAEDVLLRIGGGALIGELKEVADKVAQKAVEYQANEEAMSGAPEHFLDPIMSTLMADPVILPSSKQTVDRSTIARHLLSDQTDPFNRSPLSMDQVIPNVELAEEIRKWLQERKLSLNRLE